MPTVLNYDWKPGTITSNRIDPFVTFSASEIEQLKQRINELTAKVYTLEDIVRELERKIDIKNLPDVEELFK